MILGFEASQKKILLVKPSYRESWTHPEHFTLKHVICLCILQMRNHLINPFLQYLLLGLIILVLLVIAVLTKRLKRWIFSSSSSSASLAEYLLWNRGGGSRGGGGGGGLFRFPESLESPAGQRLRKSSESNAFYENLPI